VLIRITSGGGSLKERFRYLLVEREGGRPRDPSLVSVVWKDLPEDAMCAVAEQTKRKTKYYSLVVSFAPEDRATYLRRRDEIVQDLINLLTAGYSHPPALHVVEHLDERNPHLHITVLNDVCGRDARFYFHRRDENWLNAIQAYLRAKYNLADPDTRRRTISRDLSRRARALARKLPKMGRRERRRDAIHKFVEDLVMSGLVNSREDVVNILKKAGLEIVRTSRDYITVRDSSGLKIRLRGKYYEEGFLLSRHPGKRTASPTQHPGRHREDLATLRNRIREAARKRFAEISKLNNKIAHDLRRLELSPRAAPGLGGLQQMGRLHLHRPMHARSRQQRSALSTSGTRQIVEDKYKSLWAVQTTQEHKEAMQKLAEMAQELLSYTRPHPSSLGAFSSFWSPLRDFLRRPRLEDLQRQTLEQHRRQRQIYRRRFVQVEEDFERGGMSL